MKPANTELVPARGRLLAALSAVVLCVSTPPERYEALALYLVALAAVWMLARLPMRAALWRLAVVLPFAGLCVIFVPLLPASGELAHPRWLLVWNVIAKSVFGVLCLGALMETTPVPALLRAAEQLHAPRLLVLMAGLMYRYAFLLVEEARRMKRARDARGYRGRGLWQAPIIGRMIGALFLRSYERGERIYLAMAARGFTGSFPMTPPTRWSKADSVTVVSTLAVCMAIRTLAP